MQTIEIIEYVDGRSDRIFQTVFRRVQTIDFSSFRRLRHKPYTTYRGPLERRPLVVLRFAATPLARIFEPHWPEFLERGKKAARPVEFLERPEKKDSAMALKFERSKAAERALERMLARADAKKRKKAIEDQARSHAVRDRRIREKRARPKGLSVVELNALAQKLPLPGWQVMLARMEPGVWYVLADLRKIMPEYACGTLKFWCWKLSEDGWIERAGNPDWTGELIWPAKTVPRYVYGLSKIGQEQAVEWREALGMGEDTGKTETAL